MKKLLFILKEVLRLIGRNKLFFLLPIFVGIALIAFLVYSLGPVAFITFIYAGV